MATLVLAAAGAALGGAAGGSVAGLTTLALGKALGATLGSVIDQKIMGLGSAPVESGKVERFRIMGSSEGAALPRVFGRMRVAGQLIWSSRFLEKVSEQDVGGKGGGGGTTVREFSYSVSLALALCEGEVVRIGRIWADGQPLEQAGLTLRLHRGGEDQLPDPLIEAIEGAGNAPAYRGTAYLVIEALALGPFGNRIPQFNVELFRRPASVGAAHPAEEIRGVALVPGTGEYALATEPVYFKRGKGEAEAANVHNDLGCADLVASVAQMQAELPRAKSVSLVVSWFGDDLRCDRCRLQPAVEQKDEDAAKMPWSVSGVGRAGARLVSRYEWRPMFGGTPADASVVQAIRHMREQGLEVMFYPFILMDVRRVNDLTDPWTGAVGQPAVPWRGRITLSAAPGRPGSSDRTLAAADEVAAFFGTARASDFEPGGGGVRYTGPEEWSYRRFILHYAHLCALAGGVEAFCIGSEMRGLTQIRESRTGYPAVRALCELAEEVRAVLGPATKIGYAADWSEYFGHQPADGSGDVLFHLDRLWAHPDVDFVGIDNYMPLSDWRDGFEHADVAAGSIYDPGYLAGNVAGGEGYDWYYADADGRAAQARLPIEDGAYGEPWVFRYKDLVNWWSRPHVNRVGGVKVAGPTEWVAGSKPIWFTELGCPAVDKGTNQPNVFHDPKSSESFLPYFSSGVRDDLIQHRYLQAMFGHWAEAANNPVSAVYGGRMVDMERAHVWAWDARPWPDFPQRMETWVDGDNYRLGHWLNGRMTMAPLAELVAEVCARTGLDDVDVGALHGAVTGFAIEATESGRQSLQPLMLAYAFDSFDREGRVAFASRGRPPVRAVARDGCVLLDGEPVLSRTRAPAADAPGRVAVGYVQADAEYQAGAIEAVAPDAVEPNGSQTTLPLAFGEAEARGVAERWLAEARVARDTLALALPPSALALGPGDVLSVEQDGLSEVYRIDRVEDLGHRAISAVRVETGVYLRRPVEVSAVRSRAVPAAAPVHVEMLDLPLLTGDEVAHAPHVAVAASPWRGPVAVYSAADDYGYALNREVTRPAVMGTLLDPLPRAEAGLWSPASVRVRIGSGALQSRGEADVLNGANAAAVRGVGAADWEILQFRSAELIAAGEYRLSGLLRGQAGTDGVMPEVWDAGTDFVLLSSSLVQIGLPASARGLERHYRAGPAKLGYDDPSFVHFTAAFEGVGLRPYRPVHLIARRLPGGDIAIRWIRRTRIDGDSWSGSDVAVGEERELYHLQLSGAAGLMREAEAGGPAWLYTAAAQAEDGLTGPVEIAVAQISARFGPGPYERISFDG